MNQQKAAVRTSLLAAEERERKLGKGDILQTLNQYVDYWHRHRRLIELLHDRITAAVVVLRFQLS